METSSIDEMIFVGCIKQQFKSLHLSAVICDIGKPHVCWCSSYLELRVPAVLFLVGKLLDLEDVGVNRFSLVEVYDQAVSVDG